MSKLRFPNLYRVIYSGSRKPALIVADNYGEAAKIAYILCSKDEISCDVLSITWVDSVAKLV